MAVFAGGCAVAQPEGAIVTFTAGVNAPHLRPGIDYRLNQLQEKFYVWRPANFSQSETYGLIVYTSPAEACTMPDGWAEVLARRKFLYVAPQNAGNSVLPPRRTGLGVLAALEMMHQYKIDRRRVYAAGLSGGARTASELALLQPDIFRGTIQDCGSDFYRAVAVHDATIKTDTNGHPYGIMRDATAEAVNEARNSCKFVLITGTNDFRRGNILDIYNNGFVPDRFKCKLIDVQGMGHEDCDGNTLEAALDYLR